eukprot:5420235-Karenia_brevis.AAC.1
MASAKVHTSSMASDQLLVQQQCCSDFSLSFSDALAYHGSCTSLVDAISFVCTTVDESSTGIP